MQYYYSIWAGAGCCSPRILFTVSAVQDLHEGFMGCFYGEVSQNGNSVWEYKQWGLVCEREGFWGVRGVGLWGSYLIIYLYNLQKKESVEAVEGGGSTPRLPPMGAVQVKSWFFLATSTILCLWWWKHTSSNNNKSELRGSGWCSGSFHIHTNLNNS